MIFHTIIVTIPALANVGGLLLLLIYLYAILGLFTFAPVKLNGALDEHANFQNFGRSFLTLIRVSTGESWHELMWAAKRQLSIRFDCVPDAEFADYANANHTTVGCGNSFSYA